MGQPGFLDLDERYREARCCAGIKLADAVIASVTGSLSAPSRPLPAEKLGKT